MKKHTHTSMLQTRPKSRKLTNQTVNTNQNFTFSSARTTWLHFKMGAVVEQGSRKVAFQEGVVRHRQNKPLRECVPEPSSSIISTWLHKKKKQKDLYLVFPVSLLFIPHLQDDESQAQPLHAISKTIWPSLRPTDLCSFDFLTLSASAAVWSL